MSNYAAFRRSQATARKNRPRGNRNRAPWSADNFLLNIDEDAHIRVLHPGDAFYLWRYHWAKRKTHTCTAEMADFQGKCCYCYYNDKAEEGTPEYTMWPKVSHILEVIDFRYFHKVQIDGKDQMVPCRSHDPEPEFKRGRACKYCADDNDSVSARVFGGHKKWELSEKQFSQIKKADDQIGSTCFHQDDNGNICGKKVWTVGFCCSSCGTEFLSERELQTMEEKDVEEFSMTDVTCEKCDHEDLPMEVIICDSEKHDAVRATIHDKTIEISASGVEKNDRTYKNYNIDRSGEFADIMDELEYHGFDKDEAEKLLKPWDLDFLLRPQFIDPSKYEQREAYVKAVLSSQAKLLGKDVPETYKGGDNGSPRSRSFGSGFRRK